MKHNLMELINGRINQLVRRAGFKGRLVIEDISQLELISITDAIYVTEPNEDQLIEAAERAITKGFSNLVVFY